MHSRVEQCRGSDTDAKSGLPDGPSVIILQEIEKRYRHRERESSSHTVGGAARVVASTKFGDSSKFRP